MQASADWNAARQHSGAGQTATAQWVQSSPSAYSPRQMSASGTVRACPGRALRAHPPASPPARLPVCSIGGISAPATCQGLPGPTLSSAHPLTRHPPPHPQMANGAQYSQQQAAAAAYGQRYSGAGALGSSMQAVPGQMAAAYGAGGAGYKQAYAPQQGAPAGAQSGIQSSRQAGAYGRPY